MTNIRKSKLLKKNNRRKKKPHKIRTKKGGGESVWPFDPRPTTGFFTNKKIEMSKTKWDEKLEDEMDSRYSKLPEWYTKEKDKKKSKKWIKSVNWIAETSWPNDLTDELPNGNLITNDDLSIAKKYWIKQNWRHESIFPKKRPDAKPEDSDLSEIDLKNVQKEWDIELHAHLISIWENDSYTDKLTWWEKYYANQGGNLVKRADFPPPLYETPDTTHTTVVGAEEATTVGTLLLEEKNRPNEWLEEADIIAENVKTPPVGTPLFDAQTSAYLSPVVTESVGEAAAVAPPLSPRIGNERGVQNPTYDSGVNQLNISKYYYNKVRDNTYESLSEYIKEDINNDEIFILYMDLIILVSNLHYYGIILGNIDTTTFYRNNGTNDMPMYKIDNNNFLVSLKQDQTANEINCSKAGQIGQIEQLKENLIKKNCDNLNTFTDKITNQKIREDFFKSIEPNVDVEYSTSSNQKPKLWQNIETLMYIDLFSIENLIMTLANDINQDLIQPFKNSLNNFDIRSANSDFDSNKYIDFVDTLTIQVIRDKVSNKGGKLPAYAMAGERVTPAAAAILDRSGTRLKNKRKSAYAMASEGPAYATASEGSAYDMAGDGEYDQATTDGLQFVKTKQVKVGNYLDGIKMVEAQDEFKCGIHALKNLLQDNLREYLREGVVDKIIIQYKNKKIDEILKNTAIEGDEKTVLINSFFTPGSPTNWLSEDELIEVINSISEEFKGKLLTNDEFKAINGGRKLTGFIELVEGSVKHYVAWIKKDNHWYLIDSISTQQTPAKIFTKDQLAELETTLTGTVLTEAAKEIKINKLLGTSAQIRPNEGTITKYTVDQAELEFEKREENPKIILNKQ